MAKQEFTPTTEVLQFAFKYLQEEMEKIEAVAFALVQRLGPQDPEFPDDIENIASWRLAEVLAERAGDAEFLNTMRALLLGDETPSTPGYQGLAKDMKAEEVSHA